MATRFVIIGAGATGSYAASTLARLCPSDDTLLFSDEPLASYYRPVLPDFLCGRLGLLNLVMADAEHYRRLGVTLRQERVDELDVAGQRIVLRGGKSEPFDRLLLATGARSMVSPNWPGRKLAGIARLDRLTDVYALQKRLTEESRVIVIGGNMRALQVSEALVTMGLSPLQLVRESWIGHPLLSKPQGQFLRTRAEACGVEVRTLDEVHEFLGYEGRVVGIRTCAGGMLECTDVLVCIGTHANIGLGREALEHEDGYLVDEYYRTSGKNVFAAGDGARPRTRSEQARVRSWEHAAQDGIRAAHAMANRFPLPRPAPEVISGRVFGVSWLFLGEPPLNMDLGTIEMEKSEAGIAYLAREEGRIRQASLIGYRSAHHPLTRLFTDQVPLAGELETLLREDFDWRRAGAEALTPMAISVD